MRWDGNTSSLDLSVLMVAWLESAKSIDGFYRYPHFFVESTGLHFSWTTDHSQKLN